MSRGVVSKHSGLPNTHVDRPGHRRPPQLARFHIRTTFYDGKEIRMPDDLIDPTMLDPSDLAPPKGKVDGSCAGIPLDSWRRGDPLDEVQTAVRFVVEHPDIQTMAYCHDVSREEWQTHDNRQKAAGKAWAAREYPHLDVRLRTTTMPYRGVGNDVTVVFAEVVKPKKVP